MIEFTDAYMLAHSSAFVASFYPEMSYGFFSTIYSDDQYEQSCTSILVAFDGQLMSETMDRAEVLADLIDLGKNGEEIVLDSIIRI